MYFMEVGNSFGVLLLLYESVPTSAICGWTIESCILRMSL